MKKYTLKTATILFISIIILLSQQNILFSQSHSIDTSCYSLSTPYAAVYMHLRFMMKRVNKPEIAAKALNVGKNVSQDDAKELARKLIKIYSGKGLKMDFDKLPKDPDYTDSLTKEHRFVLFASMPDIYLEKNGKKWQYSAETVEAIPSIYEKIYPIEIDRYIELLPDFMQQRFLFFAVWKYFAILLVIGLGYIIYKLFKWIIEFVFIRIARKLAFTEHSEIYIKAIATPISYLLVFMIVSQLLPLLQLPFGFNVVIASILRCLVPLFIMAILYRATDWLGDILKKIFSRNDNKLDEHIIPLLTKILKIIIIIFGLLYVLKSLDVDITPLIAGVSIGGLAFALAAQDTVKNFFGSLSIFIDKPFELNDYIIFSGGEGVVEEIGLRSIKIRTMANSLITVPCGKIMDIIIDNMGKRNYKRFHAKLALVYNTPPELIETYIDGLKKIVNQHPETNKVNYQVNLDSFTDFSININFNIYIINSTPDVESKAQQEVMLDIMRLASHLGITFAYPTRSVFLENNPEKETLSSIKNDNKQNLLSKLNSFFEKDKITKDVNNTD